MFAGVRCSGLRRTFQATRPHRSRRVQPGASGRGARELVVAGAHYEKTLAADPKKLLGDAKPRKSRRPRRRLRDRAHPLRTRRRPSPRLRRRHANLGGASSRLAISPPQSASSSAHSISTPRTASRSTIWRFSGAVCREPHNPEAHERAGGKAHVLYSSDIRGTFSASKT